MFHNISLCYSFMPLQKWYFIIYLFWSKRNLAICTSGLLSETISFKLGGVYLYLSFWGIYYCFINFFNLSNLLFNFFNFGKILTKRKFSYLESWLNFFNPWKMVFKFINSLMVLLLFASNLLLLLENESSLIVFVRWEEDKCNIEFHCQ